MSVRWEVTVFEIHGNGDAVLFSNGLMQVAVNIVIKAINPTNNANHTLTAAELANIELIDYYNTGVKLGDGWTYTPTENEWAHSFPGSHSNVPVNEPKNNQTKRYWVSTTKIESKNIGARVRQPNNTWITTNSDKFNTYVPLRGSAPVRYSLDNTNFVRVDTASGSGWDQDNYYLTSKVHPFKKADLSGYKWIEYPIVGLRMCTAYRIDSFNKYIQYFWPMGPQKRVKVGVTHLQDGTPVPSIGAPFTGHTDITVNERANALCFTRMIIASLFEPYNYGWYYSSTVKMYDIYGNTGGFILGLEKNLVTLKNHNAFAAEELSDEPIRLEEEVILPDTLPEELPEEVKEAVRAVQAKTPSGSCA